MLVFLFCKITLSQKKYLPLKKISLAPKITFSQKKLTRKKISFSKFFSLKKNLSYSRKKFLSKMLLIFSLKNLSQKKTISSQKEISLPLKKISHSKKVSTFSKNISLKGECIYCNQNFPHLEVCSKTKQIYIK